MSGPPLAVVLASVLNAYRKGRKKEAREIRVGQDFFDAYGREIDARPATASPVVGLYNLRSDGHPGWHVKVVV